MRLPTEAEWEHAARGPESRRYPWGDEWDAGKCCSKDVRRQELEARLGDARAALRGEEKDTAKAKRLLLAIAENPDGMGPGSLCYVYVYLGYIEDRAGNREGAIAWFRKALELGEVDPVHAVAKSGIERPVTWLRHLDEGTHERQLQEAITALGGEEKDTAKAQRLLLAIVGGADGARPVSLSSAYVYLGYIEDRAGNRDAAIAWFRKALEVETGGLGGMQEIAKSGLERPITWLRHLDQGTPRPRDEKWLRDAITALLGDERDTATARHLALAIPPFTTPVGDFPDGISWCGALDMIGNVSEWCRDWWGPDYYEDSPPDDATGPDTGTLRVVRGGTWHRYFFVSSCRGAARARRQPATQLIYCGFRAACPGAQDRAARADDEARPPLLRPGSKASEEITGPDGEAMVWVPPGEFMMGSSDADADNVAKHLTMGLRQFKQEWLQYEQPAHRVRIMRGFWLGKCEVTNEQYAQFLDELGKNEDSGGHRLLDIDSIFCGIELRDGRHVPKPGREHHPVVLVSWYGARAYAQHYGMRLPTEAQWEYAARGPQSLRYPWGDEWDASKCWHGGSVYKPRFPYALIGSRPAQLERGAGEKTGEGPTDRAREHTEIITSAGHEYVIEMGGTMDGPSTRDPIGHTAWHQVFEPNQFVRLENVGDTPVVNPWVLVNGRHRWRTAQEIVDEVLGELPPDATDKERAIAIWQLAKHHRFYEAARDRGGSDPIKVFNVYGHTVCSQQARVIADLWRLADLKTRKGYHTATHCTTEVFYGGQWHLLDADRHIACLLRDNETIAGEADIARDHDLMKRTHTFGILAPDNRGNSEHAVAGYTHEGEEDTADWDSRIEHTMHFTLRPGESVEWRWEHRGKARGAVPAGSRETPWARQGDELCLANGFWRYAPAVNRPSFLDALTTAQNLATSATESPALHPDEPGKPAIATIRIETPYVIVGGKLKARVTRADADDTLRVSASFDDEEWQPVVEATETGAFELSADLDRLFLRAAPARYSYLIRLEMTAHDEVGGVGLDSLRIENDIQMAPLSLPALTLGENRITYTDESPGPRTVRLTHSWVERSSSRPPGPPSEAVYPPDGGEAEGTSFAFQWQPPVDPDGDAIPDYHFQLSNRSDLRWPLSPNFNRLISLTPDKGHARYTLPHTGLLNPDQIYYWRVRARDERGVWGPWSSIWRFTPRGPGVPLNLALERDGNRRELTWKPNPQGRAPAAYRVYGSDEKGFSVSDTEYRVVVGHLSARRSPMFPANFVAEVTGTRLRVIGPELDLPNTNKAFYRVVAVDAGGNRSGSSEYVAAPRPLIYTVPPTSASVGQAYSYRPSTISSIGDLRWRASSVDGYFLALTAFWDEERPQWTLSGAPTWLAVDPESGAMSGTPPAAGIHQIVVRAETAGAGEDEQAYTLRVEP